MPFWSVRNHQVLSQFAMSHQVVIQFEKTLQVLSQFVMSHQVVIQFGKTLLVLSQFVRSHQVLFQFEMSHRVVIQFEKTLLVLVQFGKNLFWKMRVLLETARFHLHTNSGPRAGITEMRVLFEGVPYVRKYGTNY